MLVLFAFLECVALAALIPSPKRPTQRPSRSRSASRSSFASGIAAAAKTDSLSQPKNRNTVATIGLRASSVTRKRQRTLGNKAAVASGISKPMHLWSQDDWNRALDSRYQPIASAVSVKRSRTWTFFRRSCGNKRRRQ